VGLWLAEIFYFILTLSAQLTFSIETIGIAVYTGQETKIQMNNRHAASKMSTLEGYLNMAIIIIFWSQCILVSISVISIYIMGFDDFDSKLPYVYPNNEGSGSVLPLWLEQW